MNQWSRIMVATKAFREAYVTAGHTSARDDFDAFEARKVRYDLLFSSYENTNYREIHSWAHGFKTSYGLYKSIRNIYTPTFRLVEFWKTMIFGGLLDDKAGETGAIPITTTDESLRKALAVLWEASNWKLNKDLVPLYGVSMGDVAIKIVDDPQHEQVFFEVIHPSTIKALDTDNRGHVKGYILEETSYDERGSEVKFEERVTRGEGNEVQFRTFKNGKPFAWNGMTDSWTEDYGFVPLTFIKHMDVGSKFGWAETHAARSKIHETDDLASKLHDYVRKAVDPIWLFNFKKPSANRGRIQIRDESAEPTADMPEPAREETGALYINDPKATAFPLVTNLVNIQQTSEEIGKGIAELERDYPELQMDIWTVGGYTTGSALRTARQRVERKVIQRRTAYDMAMVEANGMGVAIGGFRGYEGYEGFNLESFKAGKLKHTIPATRAIFQTDVLEGVEVKQIFWNIVAQAKKENIPVGQVLQDLGWSESRIAVFEKALAKQQAEEGTDDMDNSDAANEDPNMDVSAQDGAVSQK